MFPLMRKSRINNIICLFVYFLPTKDNFFINPDARFSVIVGVVACDYGVVSIVRYPHLFPLPQFVNIGYKIWKFLVVFGMNLRHGDGSI